MRTRMSAYLPGFGVSGYAGLPARLDLTESLTANEDVLPTVFVQKCANCMVVKQFSVLWPSQAVCSASLTATNETPHGCIHCASAPVHRP